MRYGAAGAFGAGALGDFRENGRRSRRAAAAAERSAGWIEQRSHRSHPHRGSGSRSGPPGTQQSIRQAVRYRRKHETRTDACGVMDDLAGRDDLHVQATAERDVSRRHPVQAQAVVYNFDRMRDPNFLGAEERDRADHGGDGDQPADRRDQAGAAVHSIAVCADRRRRDDGVSRGGGEGWNRLRPQPGRRRAIHVRGAGTPGPHHAASAIRPIG